MKAVSSEMTLEVEDFVGQTRRRATGIPRDADVSSVVSNLTRQLQLPEQDAAGKPILYGARTSAGDVLNPSDRIGDVVEDEATILLTKTVTAGYEPVGEPPRCATPRGCWCPPILRSDRS